MKRLFVFSALTALLAGCSTMSNEVGTGASFHGPIGLQLWSLRAQFTRNVPATIEQTRALGIHNVELAGTYNLAPDKFHDLLTAAGLNPLSAHFAFERYRDDPEGVARDAKTLGLKYAGLAWIPHNGAFDEKTCRAAAAVFNHAGEVLARQGIRFFYHVHGYEFQPYAGGTLLDLLFAETQPKFVTFEMDTTWVFFPGQDPASLLRKYPGRWELMHLKDLKKGVARGALTGSTDPNNDVVLGTGQLDWPGILKAARETGVKQYFIEDESAAAPEQIPQSLQFLQNVRW